jgi:hypothetical protein
MNHRTTSPRRPWRRVSAGALLLGVSLGCGFVAAAGPAAAISSSVCTGPNPPDWCPPPPTTGTIILNTASGQYDWGNDHQYISATVYEKYSLATGQVLNTYVSVTTHTWTANALAGFHATSWVQLSPSSYATSPQRYGVTGTLFGASDITYTHTENIPFATAIADSLTANPPGFITVEAVHS